MRAVGGGLAQQNLEQYAGCIPGLHKILAPLVLVFLREQSNFEPETISEVSAQVFIAFVNLVLGNGAKANGHNYLRHLITDDANHVEWRLDFYDKLLQRVLPRLHQQFTAINLRPGFYLIGWMGTLFLKVQGLEGLELCMRIWDNYLLYGEPFLYCIAIAIIKSRQHKLQNQAAGTCLAYFTKIKNLKVPQQSLHYKVTMRDKRVASASDLAGGTGGSGSGGRDANNLDSDDDDYDNNNVGSTDLISNTDSAQLIPLMQEAMKIYADQNAPALFREHLAQQLIAEQKHEVFTKVCLDQ